jgi:hypothetical protein
MRVTSVGCTRIEVELVSPTHTSSTSILVLPTDITCTQYTNCHLYSTSWGWASNARNTQRPLIFNKLNKKCITLVSPYWRLYYVLLHIMRFWPVYFTILVAAKMLRIYAGLHLVLHSIWISLITLCLPKTVSETSALSVIIQMGGEKPTQFTHSPEQAQFPKRFSSTS